MSSPRILIVSAALLCFLLSAHAERSIGDKFAGSFSIVSQYIYATKVNITNKAGNIMYSPAFPGALKGNMSVVFGNYLSANQTCDSAIASFSAYTGGYQIFPENNTVIHFQEQINNPFASRPPGSAVGAVQFRVYTFSDNDNLLTLTTPGASDLIWRRNYPWAACSASVTLRGRPDVWTSNGQTHQIYDIVVRNDSPVAMRSLSVRIAACAGTTATVGNSWNIQKTGGDNYNVALYSGLNAGETSTSSGFEGIGSCFTVEVLGTSC